MGKFNGKMRPSAWVPPLLRQDKLKRCPYNLGKGTTADGQQAVLQAMTEQGSR
jgi:hypothetical protein